MPASSRDGWNVPASEASLATISPIFDAMKQLTIAPKVPPPLISFSVPRVFRTYISLSISVVSLPVLPGYALSSDMTSLLTRNSHPPVFCHWPLATLPSSATSKPPKSPSTPSQRP